MDASHFDQLRHHIQQHLIGQHHLVDSMLICLLSNGHMLVEGMPGLAKTTAIKSLSGAIEGDFHRIQFTPDLLPADLIGTDIYHHERGEFEFRQGPLFHNILLADEINRAPPKVQSALLESMGEHQITVGQTTYKLPDLFMVLATQNPVEHEGTYTLPEAQLDRFLLHVHVDYPTREEELAILALSEGEADSKKPVLESPKISQADIFAAREAVNAVYLDEKLKAYIVDLVHATRAPEKFDKDLGRWQRFGASPRATLALTRCARALAWLKGDQYVSPEHIQALAEGVLRHRILLSFEAEAEGVNANMFIERLLSVVAIP